MYISNYNKRLVKCAIRIKNNSIHVKKGEGVGRRKRIDKFID